MDPKLLKDRKYVLPFESPSRNGPGHMVMVQRAADGQLTLDSEASGHRKEFYTGSYVMQRAINFPFKKKWKG